MLVIAPCARLVPLECSEGTDADVRDEVRRGRNAPRVAELGGDRQCGEVVDAAKASAAHHAGAQGLEIQHGATILLDDGEPSPGFIDGSHIRRVRLIERGQQPLLPAEPRCRAASTRRAWWP